MRRQPVAGGSRRSCRSGWHDRARDTPPQRNVNDERKHACARSRSRRRTGPRPVQVVDVAEPTRADRRGAGRGAGGGGHLPRPAADPGRLPAQAGAARSPSASTSPASCARRRRARGSPPGDRVAGSAALRRAPSGSRCRRPASSRCPDRVGFDEGAALPMNYLTAQFALADPRPAARGRDRAGARRRGRRRHRDHPGRHRALRRPHRSPWSPPRRRPTFARPRAPTRPCWSTASRTPSWS